MTTPTAASHVTTPRATAVEPTIIHLGRLRSLLTRGLLLLGEVVAVPGVLLYVFVAVGHSMIGLLAVFGWRVACIGVHRTRSRVPATCMLAFALFLTRTVAGLLVSSVSLYLLIPVLLCACQGIFFAGSALLRRPLLMRLATDYTEHIPDTRVLRRLFAQLSGVWGGVHLVCAAIGVWSLTLSASHAVAATSTLSLACTLGSVGGCIGWGLWRTTRISGLRIAFGERPHPSALPALAPSSLPRAA